MTALDTTAAAGGAAEVIFLRQVGADPFAPAPERRDQITAVANRIADFVRQARSTVDIAIYDFRLRDEAAAIVTGALKECAARGVVTRIAYDARASGDKAAGMSPASLGANQTPGASEAFVTSLAEFASLRGITGDRVLMHNKYIIRDALAPDAAILMGSANFTNDSWGLQENNIVILNSQELSSYYATDFSDLWSKQRITESTGYNDTGTVRVQDTPVTVAFTPGESATIVKEIVGAIAGARRRLCVASVVISSGPILAALAEAMDRGLRLTGIYDGPQMDQVMRQWTAAHVGRDKIGLWQTVSGQLARKNSIPYDSAKPGQPHNFMHNKVVVADDAVITGSFNLSSHAMGNAENTLLIREPDLAARYEAYITGLVTTYGG